MAKQKVKLPLKRAVALAGADVPAASLLPVKRKAKNPGKIKVKAQAETAPGAAGDSPARSRLAKAKVKPRRKEVSAIVALAPAGPVAPAASMFLPAVRSRKIRPGAPLGRLERLEIAIGEVRIGGRASPRTRKLLASGVPKMAQKVIEEAAEAAIEAVRGDHAAFVNESVDLFYNLLALCSEIGVPLSAIWAEMDRREGVLGMAEKLPKAPDL